MPKILDLFCGAGGAAMGYKTAGFEVIGVDNKQQPHFPFDMFVVDAFKFMEYFMNSEHLHKIDAIHASPPCQAYSLASKYRRNQNIEYPDLLPETRKLLQLSGLPWIIENVPGAPMRADYTLCGSQFGLKLIRHRLFEVSWGPINWEMPTCNHDPDAATICGHGTPSWVRKKRIEKGLTPNISVDMKREIMGCPWMNREELSQAIPPIYTEYIGKQLLEWLNH